MAFRYKRFLARLRRWAIRTEQFTVDVIYDRRREGLVSIYAGFLRGLSWVFSGVVQSRWWLYRKRILRDQPLGCLVVVVGNLTVGGTGKTPVVEKFARSLADRGRKVAILSRGYKSKKQPALNRWLSWITHAEPPPPKVVSDGKAMLLDSDQAGDEPYMLARNLLNAGVVVLVDKNRVKAGHYAIKKFGADTLILDDGFQYLPLRGQLNLLMVDKNNPFGNHCLLPRGILREPVKHLRRASYVFLTKSDGKPAPELEQIIRRHKADAEIIECAHRPQYLQKVNSNQRLDLSHLQQRKIASFSGIATPESFEDFLRNLGGSILYNQRFMDHYRYRIEEIDHIFRRAVDAGAEMVVTTEKDAVRIPDNYEPSLPFYYLRLEVDILSGAEDFAQAVSRICFPKKKIKATRAPYMIDEPTQK